MTPELARAILGTLFVLALLYLAQENVGLRRRVVALEVKSGGYPPMPKPLPPAPTPPAPPTDWILSRRRDGRVVPVAQPKAPMARKRTARDQPRLSGGRKA